jgi:hypothetical protein
MVTARMMAIAAGYPDADDLDALRHDPALLIRHASRIINLQRILKRSAITPPSTRSTACAP